MIKTTVESAASVLDRKEEASEDIIEDDVARVTTEAKSCVEEIELAEQQVENDIIGLGVTLSSLAGPVENVSELSDPDEAEADLKREIEPSRPSRARFRDWIPG